MQRLFQLHNVLDITRRNEDATSAACVRIVNSCCRQLHDGRHLLLLLDSTGAISCILLTSDGRLDAYHVFAEPLAFFQSTTELSATRRAAACTLSPQGSLWACVTSEGDIFVLPMQKLLTDEKIPLESHFNAPVTSFSGWKGDVLRIPAPSVRSDYLETPSSVVWYTSIANKPFIIYANKRGDIFIVDLVLSKLSVTLRCPQSVQALEVLDDAAHATRYLLVTGFTGFQWVIPIDKEGKGLRETLSDVTRNELQLCDNERGLLCEVVKHQVGVLNVSASRFQIFDTLSMQRMIVDLSLGVEFVRQVFYASSFSLVLAEDDSLHVAFRPSVVDWLSNVSIDRCVMRSESLNDDNFVNAFYLISGDTGGMWFVLTRLHLYRLECDQMVLADLFLDTFVNDCTKAESICACLNVDFSSVCRHAATKRLEAQKPEQALRLYELANVPLRVIADAFVGAQCVAFVLPHLHEALLVRSRNNAAMTDPERVDLSNEVLKLFLFELQRTEINDDARPAIEAQLKGFLLHNPYYEQEQCLDILLHERMYSYAAIVAKTHGLQERLLNEIVDLDWCDEDALIRAASDVDNIVVLLKHFDICERFLDKAHALLLENPTDTVLQTVLPLFDPVRNTALAIMLKECRKSSEASINLEQSLRACARFFLGVLLNNCAPGGLIAPTSLVLNFFACPDTKQCSASTVMRTPLACGQFHGALITQNAVYCWGKTSKGRLGVGPVDASVQLLSPTCVSMPPPISIAQVACGAEHTLCLSLDHAVYAWGAGTLGQLGMGDRTNRFQPSLLPPSSSEAKLVHITCGQYHNVGLDVEGRVFTWGWNAHGQCSTGVDDVLLIRLVQLPGSCQSVACGHAHSLFALQDGRLFSCGGNSFGQLGVGADVKKSRLPVRVLIPHAISVIASGAFHCLALTKDGSSLFTWGKCPQALKFRALLAKKKGEAAAAERSFEPPNEGAFTINESEHCLPSNVDISAIGDRRVVRMAAGLQHSLLLTEDGRVYSFGKSMDYQLGHNDRKERSTPTLITSLGDKRIVHIACGPEHTMLVDCAGLVWGCGQNTNMQLGFACVDEKNKHRFSGKVLTIQRPGNRGGQRTVQLPHDNRLFIHKPTRMVGFLAALESKPELNKQYSIDDLFRALEAYAGYFDYNEMLMVCTSCQLPLMASYVLLLQGDLVAAVEKHCATILDSVLELSSSAFSSILQFYWPYCSSAKAVQDLYKILSTFCNLALHADPDCCQVLEGFLLSSIDYWTPALFELMSNYPQYAQCFTESFKLRILRSGANLAPRPPSAVEIMQTTLLQIEPRDSDNNILVFRCGHVMRLLQYGDFLTSLEDEDTMVFDRFPVDTKQIIMNAYCEPNIRSDLCLHCMLKRLETLL